MIKCRSCLRFLTETAKVLFLETAKVKKKIKDSFISYICFASLIGYISMSFPLSTSFGDANIYGWKKKDFHITGNFFMEEYF